MIVTKDLSKRFDDIWAVDGVDLEVNSGEVLALLGPNGAGKTTTVRMLTSVLKPTRGDAYVSGFHILHDAEKVRASVGVLTEQHGLYGRMPADDYLEFFGEMYKLDASTRHSRTDKLLKEFGLFSERHRRIGEYSKGMRQKLALARAMLHDPPVLLLDEPTSAMDPASAKIVRDAIKYLRSERRAIVICTHNLAEAEELADKIAIIQNGKIIARGTSGELKEQLLGPPVFEICLKPGGNGHKLDPPGDIRLTYFEKNSIHYQTNTPEETNPDILRYLLGLGLEVVSLRELPRSLEQVYLQAVSGNGLGEIQGD
jgi:ABC-2 type transport system ATP-binding protein